MQRKNINFSFQNLILSKFNLLINIRSLSYFNYIITIFFLLIKDFKYFELKIKYKIFDILNLILISLHKKYFLILLY
jgi:hypothetical protein